MLTAMAHFLSCAPSAALPALLRDNPACICPAVGNFPTGSRPTDASAASTGTAADSCCHDADCLCLRLRCRLLRAALQGESYDCLANIMAVASGDVPGERGDTVLWFHASLLQHVHRIARFRQRYFVQPRQRALLTRARNEARERAELETLQARLQMLGPGFLSHTPHTFRVQWGVIETEASFTPACHETAKPCGDYRLKRENDYRRLGLFSDWRVCHCLDQAHENYFSQRETLICKLRVMGGLRSFGQGDTSGEFAPLSTYAAAGLVNGTLPEWKAPCGCAAPPWAMG